MTAKKAKAKKTVTLEVAHCMADGRRSTVTIVVGEKVTLVTTDERPSATLKTKYAIFTPLPGDGSGPRFGMWDNHPEKLWLNGLADPLREELGHILSDESPVAKFFGMEGIAGDWIEDHGGEREWALRLKAVDRPARESFTEERTFAIGDYATHGGYNLTYYGKILSITEKTVVVENDYGSKTRRMKIDEFCRMNWQFDLATVQKRNSEWSD